MKCPKCFWHHYYKICPICDHQIPEGEITVTHKNAKTVETKFYSPSEGENEEDEDYM